MIYQSRRENVQDFYDVWLFHKDIKIEERIAVFDRGGQFDILRNVPGSYMWVSPVPFEILAQQELVQKPCRSASRYRDVLVRRRPGALSAAEVAFINELRREIAGLVQT